MVTSRIWFTAAQKAELWERWKNGQSAAAISRALERKNKTGVERIVVLHGGIGPAPRRRALAALRFEEREEISRGIAVGRSIRQIAQGLGRAPSTVSREIRRNGGSQAYRANRADRRARERALRPKPCRLALYSALRWRARGRLCSSMVAASYLGLAEAGLSEPTKTYRYLTVLSRPLPPTRGMLKKALRRSCVLAADASPQGPPAKWTGHITCYGLYLRAARDDDRAVPGHWEGDHIEDMPLSTLRVVALGVTHPPRSTQLRRQLLSRAGGS